MCDTQTPPLPRPALPCRAIGLGIPKTYGSDVISMAFFDYQKASGSRRMVVFPTICRSIYRLENAPTSFGFPMLPYRNMNALSCLAAWFGKIAIASAFAFSTLFLSSCSDKQSSAPDPEASLYTVDSLVARGTYRITTQVPVNALLLAPAQVADFIGLIKGLRDEPAKTFFSVLDAAGLKHVEDLYAVLPGLLQDEVDDAINDYLNGKRKKDTAFARSEDELIANAEKAFTHFQIITDLNINPEDSVPMRHRFRGLGYTFTVKGKNLSFEAIDNPFLHTPLGLVVSDVPVQAIFSPQAKGHATTLTLKDHAFGMPFGRLLWDALEALHDSTTGHTMREELAMQVDCDALGSSVANTCVGFVCIGNKARVRVLCEDALDQILKQTREKFVSMGFEAMTFHQGEAQLARLLTASPHPVLGLKHATHLRHGLWDLDLDYGNQPRKTVSAFTGHY